MSKMQPMKRSKILFIAQFAILLALEAVFCFTPLGSIPLGPMVATLAMIPVIITAIMLGTWAGTLMGFAAGLFSFLVWTFMPPNPVVAFIYTPVVSVGSFQGNFWSLVICFVPRILTGTFAGLVYHGLSRVHPRAGLEYILAGVVGSVTNTALVLGGTYLFFGRDYAAAIGSSFELLLGLIGMTVLTNGIPEAVVGALAAVGICKPLKKQLSRHHM